MNTNSVLVEEHDREDFESVTEEEIIYLWRSIKGRGIRQAQTVYADRTLGNRNRPQRRCEERAVCRIWFLGSPS